MQFQYFNPRSREGSDEFRRWCLQKQNHFNPRSREGSDSVVKSIRLFCQHFNPRSREGSDWYSQAIPTVLIISIHAPVKGATCIPFVAFSLRDISIHAPVKGATLYILSNPLDVVFQSTLPWRERHGKYLVNEEQYKFQSTLPWRERHKNLNIDIIFFNFNPRSREGSDLCFWFLVL